jgi:hypothetical protein
MARTIKVDLPPFTLVDRDDAPESAASTPS